MASTHCYSRMNHNSDTHRLGIYVYLLDPIECFVVVLRPSTQSTFRGMRLSFGRLISTNSYNQHDKYYAEFPSLLFEVVGGG